MDPGLNKFRVDQVEGDEQNNNHDHFFDYIKVVYCFSSGVLGVDKPGCEHEETEISDGYIVGII